MIVMSNMVYWGDNLVGLRLLKEQDVKVDLVYIDPPFATNNRFLIDENRANTVSASGTLAFVDTVTGTEYFSALKERLMAIRSVMADTASIYVHISVRVEHRVRVLMDEVFGEHNFRNSIARIKCNPKNFNRYGYGNMRDSILFYSVSDNIHWQPKREQLTEKELIAKYPKMNIDGRRYMTTPLHAPGETIDGPTGQEWRGMKPPAGRHWRYAPDVLEELDAVGKVVWSATGNPRKIMYADEFQGKLPQDIWEYKDPQKLEYPTQKNRAMLERIIETSSGEGDTVLDCYAGSGETLMVAATLGRRFVGMDNAEASRVVIERRMKEAKIERLELMKSG